MTFKEIFEKAIANSEQVEGKEQAKSTLLSKICTLMEEDGVTASYQYIKGNDSNATIFHNQFGRVDVTVKFKRGDKVTHYYSDSYKYIPIVVFCNNEEFNNRDISDVFNELIANNDDYKMEQKAEQEAYGVIQQNLKLIQEYVGIAKKMKELIRPYQETMDKIYEEEHNKKFNWGYYRLPEYAYADEVKSKILHMVKQIEENHNGSSDATIL